MTDIIIIMNKKTLSNIIYYLLNFFLIICYIILMKQRKNFLTMDSIILLLLIIEFYIINRQYKLKTIIITLIISTILASILVLGTQLENLNIIFWNLNSLINIFNINFLMYILLSKLYSFFPLSKDKNFKILVKRKKFIITYLIIFLGLFITFLALYPGVYGYDAGYELLQLSDNNITITTHFSVLYSYILYYLVYTGKYIFGNFEVSLAIYSIFQLSFIAYVTSKITLYIYKKTDNKWLYYFSLLFFSFFPYHTILSISTCQDVFFSGFMLLIVLKLFELTDNNSDFFNNKMNILSFIINILLMCLFKNNGIYIILFTITISIIMINKDKLKLLIVMVIPIIVYFIIVGPIFSLMKIEKAESLREILSVPSQQLARTYNYSNLKQDYLKFYENSFNNIDDLSSYKFLPCLADNSKSNLNLNFINKNKKNFYMNYIIIGIDNPKSYIEAFLLNNLGIWYPLKKYYDSRMYHPYIEYNMLDAKFWNKNYIVINRKSYFPFYEKILNNLVNKNGLFKIPFVSVIFSMGFYFCTLIITIGYILINKNIMKYLIPISIIVGLIITILLAPGALFRYGYSMILLFPLLLGIFAEKKHI